MLQTLDFIRVHRQAGTPGVPPVDPPDPGTHPLNLLDATRLATFRALYTSNDPTMVGYISYIDNTYMTQTMPSFTVISVSNGSPATFTIAEGFGPDASGVAIGGATGGWSGLNRLGINDLVLATKTGAFTFTVPINTTSFGSFTGQDIAVWSYDARDLYNFNGGYQGSGWRDVAYYLGFAYQVTLNTAYSTKGRGLYRYMAKIGKSGITAPVGVDSGFATREVCVAFAWLYDWLYPTLTAQERLDGIDAMNTWFDLVQTPPVGQVILSTNGPQFSNYYVGHLRGIGAMAYAGAENPRHDEMVAWIRSRFDSITVPTFTTGGHGEGGYAFEGAIYGMNSYANTMEFMETVRTATGEDIFATFDMAQRVAVNTIYQLRPDRWRVDDVSDYAGSYTSVLQPGRILELAHRLNGKTEGKWMEWMYTHFGTHPGGGQTDWGNPVLYNYARPTEDYRTVLPVMHYSPGDEHVTWRTSWADTAVWAQVHLDTHYNDQWDHYNRSAGHLAIVRGSDYLLVAANQWRGMDGTTPDGIGGDSNNKLNWFNNSLIWDDGGSYNYKGNADYAGGQGSWAPPQTTTQYELNTAGGWAYGTANLTPAYYMGSGSSFNYTGSGRTLNTWRRSTVFAGAGTVICFDYVLKNFSASYSARLFWHFHRQATIAGPTSGVITATLNSSRLFMKSLLPAGNTPVVSNATTYGGQGSQYPMDAGAYLVPRINISDPSPSLTFLGLHAFSAGASSVSSMPATALVTSTGSTMYGATVLDGSTTIVAMFSANGLPQTTVTYAV
jgi:hypothetical protein